MNPVRRNVILLSFFHDLTEHPKPVCSAFRNTGVVRQQRYYLPLGIFRQNWEQLIHFVPFTGHRIENAGTATVFPGLCHRTDEPLIFSPIIITGIVSFFVILFSRSAGEAGPLRRYMRQSSASQHMSCH